jgi:hypothetical protein
MLPSLLAAIQNSTYGAKYIIETAPSTKFGIKKIYLLHGHLVCVLQHDLTYGQS